MTDRSRRVACLLAITAGIYGPGIAQAQSGPGVVQVEGGADITVFENFFRVAAPAEQQTIQAWTTDGRLTVRPTGSHGFELHGQGSFTRYRTIGDSRGLGVGVRLGTRPYALRLGARYQAGRPAFNVGDVVTRADLLLMNGSLTVVPESSWQIGVEGSAVSVRFDSIPERDSRLFRLGGSIRYRGVGRRLQPELGGTIGWRRTNEPEYDDMRSHLFARLISVPITPVWMSVRYGYRKRRYLATDPQSANFGRWDGGAQWTFGLVLRPWPHLDLSVHYELLDQDSSVEYRVYRAQSVTVGTTVRF